MNPTECRILPDASIRLYPEMTGFNMTSKLLLPMFVTAKLLQKSEMRKDIVIELSYKGFG